MGDDDRAGEPEQPPVSWGRPVAGRDGDAAEESSQGDGRGAEVPRPGSAVSIRPTSVMGLIRMVMSDVVSPDLAPEHGVIVGRHGFVRA